MKNEGIVLIGMAGVGKSTIGKALSKGLEFDFIDLDDYILEKDGKSKSIQEIIDRESEQAFLDLEKRRMYEIGLIHKVIAPGGSIIYHPDLMVYLTQCSTLVHLDDSFENIRTRLTDISTRGIVGLRSKSLSQVYDERRPLYRRYADVTVDCQNKSIDQIVGEITNYFHSLEFIKTL